MDDSKLTPEEYWEWMSSINLMGKRKAEIGQAEAESKAIGLEVQLKTLELKLHSKTRLEGVRNGLQDSIKGYEEIKSRIENRLGFSLNNKIIDEVTLEVKSAPENN